MTYSATKFEVATSKHLGGDTFTRNVTDGQSHRQTDFDTKLIYPFFLKKKADIKILSAANSRGQIIEGILRATQQLSCHSYFYNNGFIYL